jgi:hypothetical protein
MDKQQVIFRDLGNMDYKDSLGLPGEAVAGECQEEVFSL